MVLSSYLFEKCILSCRSMFINTLVLYRFVAHVSMHLAYHPFTRICLVLENLAICMLGVGRNFERIS